MEELDEAGAAAKRQTTQPLVGISMGLTTTDPAPTLPKHLALAMAHYALLDPKAAKVVVRVLLQQYRVLQQEKRLVQQIEYGVIAFIVAGVVAAVVGYTNAQSSLTTAAAQLGIVATDPALIMGRRASALIIALVPPFMLAGGLFLVLLNSRVRRISIFCAIIEQSINQASNAGVRVMGWETGITLTSRGRLWGAFYLIFGSAMAAWFWLIVALPALDFQSPPLDPMSYSSAVVGLYALLGLALASHRRDVSDYRREFEMQFGERWQEFEERYSIDPQ